MDRYSFAAISMFVATIGVDGESSVRSQPSAPPQGPAKPRLGTAICFRRTDVARCRNATLTRLPSNSLLLLIRKNLVASYSQYEYLIVIRKYL